MASATSIEWTKPPGFRGGTWNPTIGCRRVSPGCGGKRGEGGCYAEKMAGRIVRMGGPAAERYRLVVKHDGDGKALGQWNGRFLELPEALDIPLRARKPTAWFVDSMSDLFGEGVSNEFIAAVFGGMAASPQHIFQVLTKRPERMAAWFEWVARQQAAEDMPWTPLLREATERLPERFGLQIGEDGISRDGVPDREPWPLPNVWLGTSVERQQEADERIPQLLRTPAALRFLSIEPMLERVNVSRYLPAWFCDACGHFMRGRGDDGCDVDEGEAEPCCSKCSSLKVRSVGVNWVIVGGESGGGARPFDLGGALDLKRQCSDAQVPFFFKQAGRRPFISDVNEFGDGGLIGMDGKRCRPGPPGGAPSLVIRLRSPKGGDLGELPNKLRVRQFPKVA